MTSPEELSIPGILVLGIGQALSEADGAASVTNFQSCFEVALLKEKELHQQHTRDTLL